MLADNRQIINEWLEIASGKYSYTSFLITFIVMSWGKALGEIKPYMHLEWIACGELVNE